MDELERLKQLIGVVAPQPTNLQNGYGNRTGGPLMADRVPKFPKEKEILTSQRKHKGNKMKINELEKLLENAGMREANPDGSIGSDEGERRESLLAMFESELDELLGKAAAEADEIGGQFRSPGIKYQIRKIVDSKMVEFTRGKTEWLQRVDPEDLRGIPTMADPTGTLK